MIESQNTRAQLGCEAVLLLRRSPLSAASLAALYEDRRFVVYSTDNVGVAWPALAELLPALVVATEDEPFDALGYAVAVVPRTPVVMLVAPGFANCAPELMRAGAVSCLSMPLSPMHIDALFAELRKRFRRALVEPAFGILIDLISRQVRRGHQTVDLTPLEHSIFFHLVSAQGVPVATENLIGSVWPGSSAGCERAALEVHVCQLRKKLKRLGVVDAIRTVRGFGYSWPGQE